MWRYRSPHPNRYSTQVPSGKQQGSGAPVHTSGCRARTLVGLSRLPPPLAIVCIGTCIPIWKLEKFVHTDLGHRFLRFRLDGMKKKRKARDASAHMLAPLPTHPRRLLSHYGIPVWVPPSPPPPSLDSRGDGPPYNRYVHSVLLPYLRTTVHTIVCGQAGEPPAHWGLPGRQCRFPFHSAGCPSSHGPPAPSSRPNAATQCKNAKPQPSRSCRHRWIVPPPRGVFLLAAVA